MVNVKLIPSILPNYIPPLVGVVSHDSVPRNFDYTVITPYLLKGIQVVRPQLERVPTLNISDYNLRYRKRYGMLAPHKYLTNTKGKNLKIISQPWTMDIARSIVLNVMKIPHFGRHHEVNTCVKILFSRFHGEYIWLYICIIVDLMLIHRITGLIMQGPDPQNFYLVKDADRALV